ncbi:hypothetical protein HPB52_019822 [Rhipicephalus sanguineus]|uniref:Proline-rich transmembrane protein 3/4 domain-containing protein n=1 Tax=Rhipicephalus sanguineus TaxID=34632 RepID=A0A9D4PXL5_RHISA|nr:hypothetical protein HPB52_019822 [Rhipicephalus sanguineus]
MTSAGGDTMITSDANVSSSSGGSSGSSAGNNETPWADLWWKERVQVASPDWTELRQRVQWLWPVHAYGLACLFLGLAVTAFLTALGLRARLSARPHLSTLNVFLLVLGLTRCLCLFLDPYGSRQLMPSVMLAMLWDLAFPCLLSAFALLQLAFVQLTQAKPSPARVGDETCVSLVVVFHFCLAIASDLFWAMQNSFRVVWLFTQLSFTAWGLFLCSTCVCSCLRLQQSISQLPMLLFLPPQGPADAATDVAASSACYENKGIMALGTLERSGSGGAGRSMPRSYTASGVPMRGAWEALAPRIRVTDEHQRTISLSSAQGAGGGPSSPSNEHRTASSSSSTEAPLAYARKPSLPLCPSQLTREQQQPLMSKLEAEFSVGEQQPSSAVQQVRDQKRSTLPKTGGHSTRAWTRPRETTGSLLLTTAYRAGRGQPQPQKKRSRVERLLRQTLLAAVLGIVLCCLQGYGVAGPHGMFAATPRAAAVLPWFAYHTLHRCLELAMACTMASVTRKSLYSNCYRSHSCNEKYRGSLFS